MIKKRLFSPREVILDYHTVSYFFTGILLMFIRATRQVDWDLHLSAFRMMIPWFFASDKFNYARYGWAYWLEMTSLEKTHPGLFVMLIITDATPLSFDKTELIYKFQHVRE